MTPFLEASFLCLLRSVSDLANRFFTKQALDAAIMSKVFYNGLGKFPENLIQLTTLKKERKKSHRKFSFSENVESFF